MGFEGLNPRFERPLLNTRSSVWLLLTAYCNHSSNPKELSDVGIPISQYHIFNHFASNRDCTSNNFEAIVNKDNQRLVVGIVVNKIRIVTLKQKTQRSFKKYYSLINLSPDR